MVTLLTRPLELIKDAADLAGRLTGSSKEESRLPQSQLRTARPAARPARIGKHDADLVELVRARPGLTVAEAAAKMSLHPTALYPIIKRLGNRHQLVKIGRQLHPFSATATPNTEQLWCVAGHPWERTTTKGRKPLRCPEHR
jgi:hypothetical protein